MIIDTHAHYDDKAFDEDRAELLRAMHQGRMEQGSGTQGNIEQNKEVRENIEQEIRENAEQEKEAQEHAVQGKIVLKKVAAEEENLPSIHRIVNIGSSLEACRRTIGLMEEYDFIYGALGVHPTDSGELTEDDMQWLKKQCALEKCVAVGEIGLDYYWDEPEREIQKKWFVRQLHLAKEVNLPVVIHSRDAAQDTVDIMKAEHAEETGGVIHCFSYGKELAKIFLEMGFFIGVGGVVTFNNGRKLKEVVEYVPLEQIVLETDCPYLAPVPFRGKRNDSRKLAYVVQQIAEIKGISVKDVEEATFRNAFQLYKKLK